MVELPSSALYEKPDQDNESDQSEANELGAGH